ncbi:unnamed protein product, partial [Rotaria sp. Silwood1]
MASDSIKTRAADVYKKPLKYERQYVENFIIVWLDLVCETNNDVTKTIKEKLQVITNDVEIFDDSNACIDYITNLKNEHVLFVVPNSINQCILTIVQDLCAVSALYILCSSEATNNEKWSEPIRKLNGLFNNINELIKQIQSDIRRFEHELIGSENIDTSNISFPSSRNFNKQECSFMYSQLLKDIFLKFQDNSTSELVEYCRTIYADNPFQLAMINEFECDYQENKAIWWYTRDSFLYKMINKALRIQHVETLYNMRTFIRHLHQQLIQLSPINDKTRSISILHLYRGQRMSIGEFEKLKNNEGGLLSVSNFLSTSVSLEVALVYAGESDNETIATVFELRLNLDDKTNSSFACIEQFSQFGEDEHEWLFSMGTVFRIGDIELLNNIWHIHLTLTNDQDETIEKLTIHMSRIIQIQRPNPVVPLCRLFARMGKYHKAIELCQKNVKSINEWEMEATLNDTLALMHADEEDEDLALHYHQQALDIVAEHVDTNDPLLASYHNNVAISCSVVGQDERAIEHYQMAINLELKAPQPDYTNIAYSYDSMGCILHYCFEKYDEAINCYERALQLMLVHLPSTHPDIFSLYNRLHSSEVFIASATMLTTSQPVAATSKEFSVKLPKIRAQYGIIEFASGFSIDIKDWKAIDMKREVNPCTYRSAVDINHNVSSASTLFTTSLGIVLSKTGAGTKGTNIEDFPWLLTTHSSTEKNLKHYQGLKKGGAPANSSYYIFIQNKDGFEAYSLEDWYAFTSTKHKHLSKWFLQHQIKKEHDNDEKENKSKTKKKHSFKLLDCEDWINDHEENEDENETSHTK